MTEILSLRDHSANGVFTLVYEKIYLTLPTTEAKPRVLQRLQEKQELQIPKLCYKLVLIE